jgi:hypothetical protein
VLIIGIYRLTLFLIESNQPVAAFGQGVVDIHIAVVQVDALPATRTAFT